MTENKGDLISREALLKAMEEERRYLLARGQTGAEHIIVHHCLPIIDNAPTVEPNMDFAKECYANGYEDGKNERPQGEWKKCEDNRFGTIWYRCPFCDEEPYYANDINTLHFCPNCGADMRGDKNGKS